MDKSYESEFTRFMDLFLQQHPEAAAEQMQRWHWDWDPKPHPVEGDDEDDLVPYVPMDYLT